MTAVAGYALQSWLPEALLQLVVGTLLLIFGLQWLRKAILRAAGITGLAEGQIVEFARLYGATKRSFLRLGSGRRPPGGDRCR